MTPPDAPQRPQRAKKRARRRTVAATAALLAAAGLALAGCGSSSSGGSPAGAASTGSTASSSTTTTAACSSHATHLTFWGWPAGYNLAVDEFNKTHPDICVSLQNVGASTAEYVKLSDALKAHSGTPDLATIEYFELPSFEITHSLVNLSQYGIDSAKADEAPAAWQQVSEGSKVYAMPVDLGPLALYYNSAEFAKNHLAVPTTWAQFASEATQLRNADHSAAITNFDPESTQDVLALMQQWGAFPFTYSGGTSVGIHFTGASEMTFARFWQNLISQHEATTQADFSPGQWAAFDDGDAASRLSPAWGPVGMQLSISKTLGDWRAAPMPQVSSGDDLAGNWGGSTIAVIAGTAHAKQAEVFARWFGGSSSSWSILSGPVGGAFPGYLPLLNNSTFQARTLKISSSSHYNQVFADAAEHVVDPQWPPIMTAALTQWTSTFAGVTKGTETLPQAFTTFQQQLVSYARAQGFTVTGS